MRKNEHVQPACERLLSQIRNQINSLRERQYIFERIGALRLAEADDLQIAENLNRLADGVEASGIVESGREALAAARDLERGYKALSKAQGQ